MKETIGNVVINYQFYSGTDLYSDGPIEDELLQAAQTYTEDELEDFIEREGRWEFLYHFSGMRHNIVKDLHVSKTHKVLEIGAGCGAVTGALAKKAGKVTCIELSKKRSLINAYRNREAGNIEILVGNFEDIEAGLEETYDYITLIGVFEYAALYIKGEEPYHEFLKKICRHLNPGGKIVIAIENRIGLKYWAGCREDHTGAWFDGIENYGNVKNVKTFTKSDLEKVLKESGLSKWEFYYPHPDYKLPVCIFSDGRLPQKNELAGAYHSYDKSRLRLFDEAKAYEGIIDSGLYPVFANSFLVIAGDNGMELENLGYLQYEDMIRIPEQEEYTLKELLDAKKKCDGYVELQIFWDFGNGFCEEQSRMTEVKPDGEGMIFFEQKLPEGAKRFRIDPGNEPCVVQIEAHDGEERAYEMVTCNGTIDTENRIHFLHEDPWAVYECESNGNPVVAGWIRYDYKFSNR